MTERTNQVICSQNQISAQILCGWSANKGTNFIMKGDYSLQWHSGEQDSLGNKTIYNCQKVTQINSSSLMCSLAPYQNLHMLIKCTFLTYEQIKNRSSFLPFCLPVSLPPARPLFLLKIRVFCGTGWSPPWHMAMTSFIMAILLPLPKWEDYRHGPPDPENNCFLVKSFHFPIIT